MSSVVGQPVKSEVLKNDCDAFSTTGMYGRSRAISVWIAAYAAFFVASSRVLPAWTTAASTTGFV
ncbi:hypothetical protein D3C73_1398570 [compost metagenome]